MDEFDRPFAAVVDPLDSPPPHPGSDPTIAAPVQITADPFVWQEPSSIAPRRWLYGHHFVRQYVSCTVAPGGLGKSSLVLVEALAMASGRALLGPKPRGRLAVWYFNGEDPRDEIQRRVTAIMIHYGIRPEEIEGRLFINSGRDTRLMVAERTKDCIVVHTPIVNEVVREIEARKIDVLIVDPFVSMHGVPENDNGAIDRVAKTFAAIAAETNAAVEIVHHVRKAATGQAEFTIEDARGAVALIGAVRSARVLNVMSVEEATKAEVQQEERRTYFRVDNGKSNMRPPSDGADWRRIRSVGLGNATADDGEDWVGVVEAWHMPSAFAGVTVEHLRAVQQAIAGGEWRASEQAEMWVGKAVARVLGLDVDYPAARKKIKALLKIWLKSGALKEVQKKDGDRKPRPFVEVGEWASD